MRILKSIEAIVDPNGSVKLKEPVHLSAPCRAIVTILDDEDAFAAEISILSEASLAEDWNRPEEDEAWSHLQQGQ